jgi:2-keto-3-deoxy-L-rhamnonate aldolase RhmA
MVGHMDLRFDLGLSFGGAMDEPEYVNAVSNILAAAKKNNDKPVLTFAAGPAACESYYKMGFRILMVGSDSMSLSAHSRQLLQSSHEMMRRVDKEAAAAPK